MGKNQDPGSGINIPDPQHCFHVTVPTWKVSPFYCAKDLFNQEYGDTIFDDVCRMGSRQRQKAKSTVLMTFKF
jgi:hypothetical protein